MAELEDSRENMVRNIPASSPRRSVIKARLRLRLDQARGEPPPEATGDGGQTEEESELKEETAKLKGRRRR